MCGAFEKLSPRELEVVALVARGLANKEIACGLEPPAGESTVKEHLRRIFQKVAVESRTQLVIRWHEHQGHDGSP